MKEWPEFLKREWSQLNKYHKQGMFITNKGCSAHHALDHRKDPKQLSYTLGMDIYLFKIDPITLEENANTHYGKLPDCSNIARIVLKSDQKSGQILQSGNEGASGHLHPRIVSIRRNLPGL
jgi:hypothetical protein